MRIGVRTRQLADDAPGRGFSHVEVDRKEILFGEKRDVLSIGAEGRRDVDLPGSRARTEDWLPGHLRLVASLHERKVLLLDGLSPADRQ